VWPLTKKQCIAQSPPHRLQLVIAEAHGNSQVCMLCGTTLVKARKVSRARSPRQAA
jgi:hypothetical protein